MAVFDETMDVRELLAGVTDITTLLVEIFGTERIIDRPMLATIFATFAADATSRGDRERAAVFQFGRELLLNPDRQQMIDLARALAGGRA